MLLAFLDSWLVQLHEHWVRSLGSTWLHHVVASFTLNSLIMQRRLLHSHIRLFSFLLCIFAQEVKVLLLVLKCLILIHIDGFLPCLVFGAWGTVWLAGLGVGGTSIPITEATLRYIILLVERSFSARFGLPILLEFHDLLALQHIFFFVEVDVGNLGHFHAFQAKHQIVICKTSKWIKLLLLLRLFTPWLPFVEECSVV